MKYLALFLNFFKASFKADLEYRANFLIRIITDIFWYISQIMIFEVIYLHTDQLGNWSLAQSRIFLSLLFIVDAFYMIFFHDNLERLSDRVRKGELDLLLVKPISSQFMISFQRMSPSILGNACLATGYFIYSLITYSDLNWNHLIWIILLLPLGLLALYSVRFCIATLALILVRAENIQYLWYQVYRLGMRPDQIYPQKLRLLIWTILPVGLVANAPSHFLFNGFNLRLFLTIIISSTGFFWISTKFWKYALKQYSSASS